MPESGYTTRSALVSLPPAVAMGVLLAVLLLLTAFLAGVPLAGMIACPLPDDAPTVCCKLSQHGETARGLHHSAPAFAKGGDPFTGLATAACKPYRHRAYRIS